MKKKKKQKKTKQTNKQKKKTRLHKPYLVTISVEKTFQPKLSTQPHNKNRYNFSGNC